MSESDENKIKSLLSSYKDNEASILYLDGLIDASHGDEGYLKRLREEKRKRELNIKNDSKELNILAEKYSNIYELKPFL